jgi:hypothetical protein
LISRSASCSVLVSRDSNPAHRPNSVARNSLQRPLRCHTTLSVGYHFDTFQHATSWHRVRSNWGHACMRIEHFWFGR